MTLLSLLLSFQLSQPIPRLPIQEQRSVIHVPVERPKLTGKASYYDKGYKTASGELFDPNGLTAAYMRAPFGTMLRVTNVATGASVDVRVNDRGGFEPLGRVIDLSRGSFEQIGKLSSGIINVSIEEL